MYHIFETILICSSLSYGSSCIKIFGTLALPIAEKQLLESAH